MEFQVNFHNNSSEKTQKSIPSFPQVGVKIKKSLKPLKPPPIGFFWKGGFFNHETNLQIVRIRMAKTHEFPKRGFKSNDFHGWNHSIPHRIHGTGIFTYMYHKNQPNVGEYSHTWILRVPSKNIQVLFSLLRGPPPFFSEHRNFSQQNPVGMCQL